MFLSTKKKIKSLVKTILEIFNELSQFENTEEVITDCLNALEIIRNHLTEEKEIPKKTIRKLEDLRKLLGDFYKTYNDNTAITSRQLSDIIINLKLLDRNITNEIKNEVKVLFLPYKASMWDSLETIYKATTGDKNCVTHVVPIPYYQLTQEKKIPMYEGNRFPGDIPITHYSEYDIKKEQPDIIFVHNIYDNFNTLTRIHEEYHTSNLKNYTDMLVYVPYGVSDFVVPKKDEYNVAYTLPTVKNVDRIILAGDFLREAAIRYGIPSEKLLSLGTPKFDKMVKVIKEDVSLPIGWKEKIEEKTVYVLNTGCLFLVNNPWKKIEILTNLLNIPTIDEKSVLIWRPHPLTKASIIRYAPQLLSYYDTLTNDIKAERGLYQNIIFDESESYFPALKAADVLISEFGSLLNSFLLTEKKVIFLGKDLPERSLVPSKAFYYFYNDNEPWYSLIKKFGTGYDPLAKTRKGVSSKIYANVDGTCGEKVYHKIKRTLESKQ